MARIRSLHPEQWTDDRFVTCSPLARLLALGLRNESDDNGIFEWSPIKLKMRILPADNCDITGLLDELEQTNQIARFEADGKQYGMIRSFQKFQKPKKPTFYHPIPSGSLGRGYELSKASPEHGSEPVPNQFRNSSADGEEEERECKTPPTPDARDPRKFEMSRDWLPDEERLAAHLQIQGVPVKNITAEHRADVLGEFISYWLSRPESSFTQEQWEQRLAKQFKRAAVVGRSRDGPGGRRTDGNGGADSQGDSHAAHQSGHRKGKPSLAERATASRVEFERTIPE